MKQVFSLLFVIATAMSGQVSQPPAIVQSGAAPSGSCTTSQGKLVFPSGTIYTCQNGTWAEVSGGGGGGLPTAASPGQIISSTAAGTTYAVQGQVFYNQTGDTISSIEAECSSLCTYVVTVPQTITLAADHTLSSNVQLTFLAGGLWTVNGAHTLTIPGNVAGTLNQHFAGSSTITGLRGEVPVEWFGAVGFTTMSAAASGSDYTTQINKTIQAIFGGQALLQCLSYNASSTLDRKSVV